MGDVATQCRQLRSAQRLQCRAVAPIDAVAQHVGGHVAAGDGQGVNSAFQRAGCTADAQARRHVVDADVLRAEHEGPVFVGGAHHDAGGQGAVGVGVAEAACGGSPLRRREALDAAITPGDGVARAGVRTRVHHSRHAQRVGLAFVQAVRATQHRARRDVVDVDGLRLRCDAAIAVVGGDGDGAWRGVDRAVFVVDVGVGDIAAQRGQLRRSERLHRRAIAPVDGVAEHVGRHVGAHDVQRVQRAFVAVGIAGELQARRGVGDGQALGAQDVGAVFIRRTHDDGAPGARADAVCIHVREDTRCRSPLRGGEVLVGRAVAPADAVAGAGVRARVDHRPHVQRVGGAFGHRGCAAHRRCRGDVDDRDAPDTGICPDAVFVGHAHADLPRDVAVVVDVVELPVGREVNGQHGLHRAVAPVDDVLADGVGAWVIAREGHRVGAALEHRAAATDRDRRRDVVHVDQEAVAADLLHDAAVVHRHRHGVGATVVGVAVADVEAELACGDVAAAGLPVAPVHGVGAAGRSLVGGVVEGDRAAEESAFVDGGVGARVDRDHLGRCADADGLGAGVGIDAVFVGQAHDDGLGPERQEGVREDAAGGQRGGGVDLLRRAVAPIDAVLGDVIVTRVVHGAEVERVDQPLLHRVVAEERDRRRDVADVRSEAAALDAVALALLVVDRDRHRVVAVVGIHVRDVGVGEAGHEHRVGTAIAPVHRDLVRFGVGVADGDAAAEGVAFAARGVGERAQAGPVVHVAQHDVGEHRRAREGHAVAARPAELVVAEVVDVALVGQQTGLQLLDGNLLPAEHRCAIEPQVAFGRQRDDLDGLQALAVGVVEAAFEERVAQRDHRLFGAGHRHVLDVRCGVAEALQADLVGVVAAVGNAVAIAVAGGDVAGVSDHEAAIGHAGHGGLPLRGVAVGVDECLAVHRAACAVVLLREDVVAADAGVGPGDHPAA